MSHLISAFYEDTEPERYRRDDDVTRTDPSLLFEAGLVFESCFEEAIQRRYIGLGSQCDRPEELTHEEDGLLPILYNPDLLIYENGVFRVGEIKLTWKSTKGVPREQGELFPPKFAKYETQLKLYCRCLRTLYGRLIVYFVNKDWKRNGLTQEMGPELLAWNYEFSRQELDEEWAMIIGHARERGII